MIYLYVKQHNITKLKYLGKTSQNPYKYTGSGKYWKNHLKVHGNDVSTFIIAIFNTNESLKNFAEYYSKINNIVESESWANLKLELGDGGTGPYNHEANKINAKLGGKASAALNLIPWNKGISVKRTQESIEKQRNTIIGKKRGPYKNYRYTNAFSIEYKGIRYPSLSECSRKTGISRKKLKQLLSHIEQLAQTL